MNPTAQEAISLVNQIESKWPLSLEGVAPTLKRCADEIERLEWLLKANEYAQKNIQLVDCPYCGAMTTLTNFTIETK